MLHPEALMAGGRSEGDLAAVSLPSPKGAPVIGDTEVPIDVDWQKSRGQWESHGAVHLALNFGQFLAIIAYEDSHVTMLPTDSVVRLQPDPLA